MDFNFLENSLKNYIEILSSKTPAPGGGSATALCASLSSSLLNMVLNYTIGKKQYSDFEEELKKIKEKNEEILKECINLIEEDSKIYYKIDKAMKEKLSPEEYLKLSINLHFKICQYMSKIVDFCDILTEKGNINLISDTGISNILAFSSFISAKMNILINLKYIGDENLKKEIKGKIEEMEKVIKEKSEFVNKKVIEKMGV
jgi:glutamate formiminotransferase/formiminotetrahydrofolate cyclodeaminase